MTVPAEQPPVSGVAGLDHAGVTVTDLDAAVAFFVDWFGARVAFRLDRVDDPTGTAPARLGAPAGAGFALAMLTFGRGRLELVQWWAPASATAAAAPVHAAGAAHVAVEVDDVAGTVERLRVASGVEVIGEPVRFDHGPTAGLTNAFLTTPWGLLIELVRW